jgi:apolipoprotein N-acyltransferase
MASRYMQEPNSATGSLRVSVVQFTNTHWRSTSYGKSVNGVFSDPSVEASITEAAKNTSLLVYPYSVVSTVFAEEILRQEPPIFTGSTDVGNWVAQLAPTSTTVVLWNNFQETAGKYSELTYWENNQLSIYKKRELHPFSDYMPGWVKAIGFTESPYSYLPGSNENQATVQNMRVGGLICSEVEQQSLARYDTTRSAFLVSVGTDAIFPGSISGNYSLVSARFRAAENNIAVIRGNIIGPSAVINPNGSIQASLPYDIEGVLRGEVPTQKGKTTLFGWFGSLPLYIFIAAVVGFALLRKAITPSLAA